MRRTLIAFALASVPMAAATCDSLKALNLPNTTITSAEVVAAGAFTPPGGNNGKNKGRNVFADLPSFCRVTATLAPTSDSDIKIEVWLPAVDWNKKYEAVGNGGWAGVISYPELSNALRSGYATSSTDTGHVGATGTFALGHPEKLADYSWRSEHEMAVQSKAIIQAFYGSAPTLSYWNGCSTGGRQGLQEAQRFPNDFDGIITGAPANRTALALWIPAAVLKDKDSYIPPAKYPAIHQAVIDTCDAIDGVKDGLIENPTRCKFDPKILLCKGGDAPTCLTAPQVEAAKKIYDVGKNSFSPLVPGTELGWATLGGAEPSPVMIDHYKYVVFKDANWDWRTFNFDRDVAKSNQPENVPMNATNPNMGGFFGHNGKLLMYHGWNDPNIAALATIKYYKSAVDTIGNAKKASDSIRLFMVPGMGHCGGGEGPNVFSMIGALEQWVEQGKAPEQVVASHSTAGKVDRTRPLCPYPQVAKYKGNGSIDEAANFSCVAP